MTFHVFVSSTSDLEEYRTAAAEVCHRLGMFPILMENFNAMGLTGTVGSLVKLDEAHVYVGIVGWRYGHIGKGFTRSVTAEEHHHAGGRIERLCFVSDPDFAWPPSHVDADRRNVDAFRKELHKEMRGLFTTVDDFKAKLTSALVDWRERRANAGPETLRVRKLGLLCQDLPMLLLLDCYRGAVSEWAPTDDLRTAWDVVNKLADVAADPHDVPPLLKFAALVEQQVDDEDRRARASTWIQRAAANHHVEDDDLAALRVAARERRRVESDRLSIRLDDQPGAEPTASGPGEPCYLMRVTVQHGDGPITPLPGDDDQAYLLAEVRDEVVRSVREWTRDCDDNQLTVEFVVPTTLLGEPFDQWPVAEADEDVTPLGVLFGVSVRDVIRADHPPTRALLGRWQQLHASRGGGKPVRWVPLTMTKLPPLRALLLRSGREWVCLAFERLTSGKVARQFLAVGMEMDAPVILWVRALDNDEDAVVAQVRERIDATPLPQLPAKLLDLRREAIMEDAPHCGEHLGLLWDDPQRRPPAAGVLRTPA